MSRTTPTTSRRRPIALALVAMLLIAIAVPLAQSMASALPPVCQPRIATAAAATNQPCTDPPDDPPPPPPDEWNVNTLLLVQDPAGLTGPVVADRFWNASGTVTPAGSVGLAGAALHFPDDPLPAGATMTMRVREDGSPGSLCRTSPVAPLPPSWTSLHVLVPRPTTESPAQLDALVAPLVGPQTGLPLGISLNITTAHLTPQDDGIMLAIAGTIDAGDNHMNFGYHLLLNLDPVTGPDLGQVLSVRAADAGTVDLSWIGTPPANGDFLLAIGRALLGPQLKDQVLAQAGPVVNSNVTSLHDVKWWTDQGFTLSMRRVTYSSSGLTVSPSLCLFG
ncbi:MAG: hypothetical protein ACXWCM_12510 [Acidimicrobiales bacterium]